MKNIRSKHLLLIISLSIPFILTGCLATSEEVANLRDDMHEMLLKLNEMQRNQADLSAKMDSVSSNLTPISSELQETQNKVSQIGQRFDDVETNISQKVSKLAIEANSSTSAAVAAPAPSEMYRIAYSDFSRGKYDLSITGFKSYLEKYPQGELAAQAQYFLGESYYSQNMWEKAFSEFDIVEKSFPKSESVPPARLKKALCLELLGKRNEGYELLKSLIKDFPSSPESFTAREKLEANKTNGK